MLVSSTLVNLTDDAEQRMVAILVENGASGVFQQKAVASLEQNDSSQLVRLILENKDAVGALVSMESQEEALGAFVVLVSLIEKAGSASSQLCDQLANAVAASAGQDTAQAQRKVTLLAVLYNMRSHAEEKCTLVARMFQIAGTHSTLLTPESTLGSLLSDDPPKSLAQPATPRIVSIIDTWNVDVKSRRELYQTIYSVLPAKDGRGQRFLLLLVESYETAGDVDAKSVEAAKNAVVGAVRDPFSLFLHQRNLLQQPAVQALAKENKVLVGLLTVFQEGKLSDYDAFMKANGGENAVLDPLGLDPATCQRDIKILSLCSLASEHEEIPYQVIADTLHLPSQDEVESWVIAAVNSGLLEAKMDQLAKQVVVERCAVRKFDMSQWKVLQERLKTWKENVGGVLATLEQTQAAAAKTSSS